MNSKNVKPKRWTNLTILSDDGAFSYAYGNYWHDEDYVSLELAGRWNGGNECDVGFPSQGGNPTWFVMDQSMVKTILSELESRAFGTNDAKMAEEIFKARKAFGL